MKKAVSLILILLTLLTALSSCKKAENDIKYPLTVNGTPIDGEIFKYYLDYVWKQSDSKEARLTDATHMCIRYVAVNSTFASYSLSLSDAQKKEISDEANVLWNMFSAHYESIGVSKQTFIKIRTSEAYLEMLRLHFFDKGGTDEISDAVLRGVLNENYVAFRYIRTPVMDTDVYGHEVPLGEEELALLNEKYNAQANSFSHLYGIEGAYTAVSEEFPMTEITYDTVVIDANDNEFLSAFFSMVKKLEDNKAAMFNYGKYVYLVQRLNILADDSVFTEKRSDCLRIISETPLQSKVNMMCNAYQSKRDTTLVNDYYSEVAKIK